MYKIKLVQENPKVGDIQGNLDLAKSHIIEAKEKGLDLIIFSEMFLTGYPPEDLLLRQDFLMKARVFKELEGLSKEISIIIGCPSREEKIFLTRHFFIKMEKLLKIIKSKFFLITKNSMKKDIFERRSS